MKLKTQSLHDLFIIICIKRGESIVEHGIVSIACHFNNTFQQLNILPFKAQVDNVKQPDVLTKDALNPHEAMMRLDEMLEKNKGKHCIILGDISGITYYLNMSECKGVFERPFKSFEVMCDSCFLNTQGKDPIAQIKLLFF